MTQSYCACHTKRLSTHYQTGWNVTKCYAATPATQNDITTSFASFPQRHSDASRKPELRDETYWSFKTSISCETPPIFTFCSFKIDVFLRVFLWTSKFATSKSMFRARLPSIFSTSHKMPRPPCNLHLVTSWRSSDNAIRKKTRNTTRLKCCACHAKWRWARPKCCACHENFNASTENVAKVLRLKNKKASRHVTKHVWMSRSATHTLNPRPQSETGTLATHSGKRNFKSQCTQSKMFLNFDSLTSWQKWQRQTGWLAGSYDGTIFTASSASCWSLCKTGWSLYCLRLGAFCILAQEPTEKHVNQQEPSFSASTNPLSTQHSLVSTWTVWRAPPQTKPHVSAAPVAEGQQSWLVDSAVGFVVGYAVESVELSVSLVLGVLRMFSQCQDVFYFLNSHCKLRHHCVESSHSGYLVYIRSWSATFCL